MTANGCPDALLPATAHVRLGIYPADDFEIATGATVSTRIPPSAPCCFRRECIAVPKPGIASAGFARRTRTLDAGRIVWERAGSAREWKDKPALAVIVNGAQGDDDEARAGRFAVGTARWPRCLPAPGRSSARYSRGPPLRPRIAAR